MLAICKEQNVEGITLHGGEPLDQADGLIDIVDLLKKNGFSVILFTGYNKKELKGTQLAVWNKSDLIVCGRFIEEKKNLYMQFRGSTNQRVITHKGPYKDYKVTDGETVAIFTVDDGGNINIKGFYSEDMEELRQLVKRKK